MNDEAAFLAAIAADPKDDLGYLVFADWLQEQGEEVRAGLVRDPRTRPLLGTTLADPFPALKDLLRERSGMGVVRDHCVMFGATSLTMLSEVLRHSKDSRVLLSTLEVIYAMGQTARPLVPVIQTLSEHSDYRVRNKIPGLVGQLRVEDLDRVDAPAAVFESVDGEYPRLEREVVRVIGPERLREEILPRLDRDWLSLDPKVRTGVLATLMVSELPEAVGRILKGTRDPVAEVRLQSIDSLRGFPHIVEVRRRLLEMLCDPLVEIRRSAIDALFRIGRHFAEPPIDELRRALDDPDPQVVSICAQMLCQLGPVTAELRAKIRECLPRLDSVEWRCVVGTLLPPGDASPDIQSILIDRLASPDPSIARDALLVPFLERLDLSEVRPELLDALARSFSRGESGEVPHYLLFRLASARPVRPAVMELFRRVLTGIVRTNVNVDYVLRPLGESLIPLLADTESDFLAANGDTNMARVIAQLGTVGVDFLLRIRQEHPDNRSLSAAIALGLSSGYDRDERVLPALIEMAPMFADSVEVHSRISRRVEELTPVDAGVIDGWMQATSGLYGKDVFLRRIPRYRHAFHD